jgi:hypothetical protein
MNYGFNEYNKFYVEYETATRLETNMRQETEIKAVELYKQNSNIIVCLSSGLDSQSVLHSFITQGIHVEYAFLYLPGVNEGEFQNLQILEKKYGFKTTIIDLDIESLKDRVLHESAELDVHPICIVHKIFIEQLPSSATVTQMAHDPFIYITSDKKRYFVQSYYDIEIMKMRTYSTIDRSGICDYYGTNSNFLYSILNDPIHRSFISSHEYFDGNGVTKPGVRLTSSARYDYYIKPVLYGMHWRDELIYFPKQGGYLSVPWLDSHIPFVKENRSIVVGYERFLDYLKSQTPGVWRVNQHES